MFREVARAVELCTMRSCLGFNHNSALGVAPSNKAWFFPAEKRHCFHCFQLPRSARTVLAVPRQLEGDRGGVRYNAAMVELKVLTLIVTGMGSPSFLVLQPIEESVAEGKSRVVPICIGPHEAMGLGTVLESAKFTRPTTHDLMLDALTNLDARIDHVVINDMKGGTFFSRLCITQYGRLIDLDARPSDSIALALRQGAKIYIDEDVLERASFPYLFNAPYDEEAIVEDFKTFLDDISPEDFA